MTRVLMRKRDQDRETRPCEDRKRRRLSSQGETPQRKTNLPTPGHLASKGRKNAHFCSVSLLTCAMRLQQSWLTRIASHSQAAVFLTAPHAGPSACPLASWTPLHLQCSSQMPGLLFQAALPAKHGCPAAHL